MFTCVGVPKEILSVQGSQLLSAVMKEDCRLFSVKQNSIHSVCNGLVEKWS